MTNREQVEKIYEDWIVLCGKSNAMLRDPLIDSFTATLDEKDHTIKFLRDEVASWKEHWERERHQKIPILEHVYHSCSRDGHVYTWGSGNTGDPIPEGMPCVQCGHPYKPPT